MHNHNHNVGAYITNVIRISIHAIILMLSLCDVNNNHHHNDL